MEDLSQEKKFWRGKPFKERQMEGEGRQNTKGLTAGIIPFTGLGKTGGWTVDANQLPGQGKGD